MRSRFTRAVSTMRAILSAALPSPKGASSSIGTARLEALRVSPVTASTDERKRSARARAAPIRSRCFRDARYCERGTSRCVPRCGDSSWISAGVADDQGSAGRALHEVAIAHGCHEVEGRAPAETSPYRRREAGVRMDGKQNAQVWPRRGQRDEGIADDTCVPVVILPPVQGNQDRIANHRRILSHAVRARHQLAQTVDARVPHTMDGSCVDTFADEIALSRRTGREVQARIARDTPSKPFLRKWIGHRVRAQTGLDMRERDRHVVRGSSAAVRQSACLPAR